MFWIISLGLTVRKSILPNVKASTFTQHFVGKQRPRVKACPKTKAQNMLRNNQSRDFEPRSQGN